MNIAFVYPSFHSRIGGAESCISHLAAEYSAKKHKVMIITSDSSAPPAEDLPFAVTPVPTKKFSGYPVPIKKQLHHLKEFNPDVIHFHGPHPFSTAVAWHARKIKTRKILTYHAHVNPKNPFKKMAAMFERLLYRFLFDRIIVTTEWYKREVSKFYPASRIHVVPPGVDDIFKTSKLEPLKKFLHRKPHILFVGGLDTNHRYKGVEVLLRCAALTPGYHYTIVGDGNRRDYFMKKAKALKNVEFMGNLSEAKLVRQYQAANLLVLPSTSSSEGFGMVLLEAMACGTPVITTLKAGSRELLARKQAAHMVRAGRHEALKAGIEKVLGDRGMQARLIANGMEMVKSMAWPHIASQTVHVYADAR